MQALGGQQVSRCFKSDGRDAESDAKKRCQGASETVPRQPDLAPGVHVGDVVEEVRRGRVVD